MALPEPSRLRLCEAADYVARRGEVDVQSAKDRLHRAFRDGELIPIGNNRKVVEDWDTAAIDWENSSITWRSPSGDGGYFEIRLSGIWLARLDIDEWMPAPRPVNVVPTPAQPEPNEHIYLSGAPGRPTSRNLAEEECRRRYAAGEHHAGRNGESAAKWARVLQEWLETTHPAAPKLGLKALGNLLPELLRKLQSQC
jgi:hypothetical protein